MQVSKLRGLTERKFSNVIYLNSGQPVEAKVIAVMVTYGIWQALSIKTGQPVSKEVK
jgi:hypothetical protein